MHFGARGHASARGDEPERASEDALIRCLEAQRATAAPVDHLYLVGDVFDGFVEYRHLVPKGFVRFQAMLAQWTDDGVPVTYLVGNHDPWHRDYFEEELGVRVVETVDTCHAGLTLHLEHGDAVGSTHGLYPALRPWLRHPASVWAYRTLLPADLGIGLARWVSGAVRRPEPDPDLVAALETYATNRLATTAADVVVMGHSHVPALVVPSRNGGPDGAYLNTGNWFDARTFGRLHNGEIHLTHWNGTRAVDIEATVL